MIEKDHAVIALLLLGMFVLGMVCCSLRCRSPINVCYKQDARAIVHRASDYAV